MARRVLLFAILLLAAIAALSLPLSAGISVSAIDG
jgi:hypothetical protein